MTENTEAFFINKCSSMSFKELGQYLAMCFEYLENPQKHLDNVKKIPVLKKTYDELLEKLELKLLKIENLVFCKNKFNELKKLEIGKTFDTKFTNLEQYYKEIELDKNNIVSEVAQTKREVEKILTMLLQVVFSEVRLAAIFVNSSEPYYKVIKLLEDLSNLNKEVMQVINSYRLSDFMKLFAANFELNENDRYMREFFLTNNKSDTLIIFGKDFINVTHKLIEKISRLNRISHGKFDIAVVIRNLKHQESQDPLFRDFEGFPRNHILKANPKSKKHKFRKQHSNTKYHIEIKYNDISIRIDNKLLKELSETYKKLKETNNKMLEKLLTNKLDKLKAPIEFEYNESYRLRLQKNQRLLGNQLENLEKSWGEFKKNHSSENLSLEDEMIEDICSEKDLQIRLYRLTELEREWEDFRREKNVSIRDVAKTIDSKYKLEKEKYTSNFVATLSSLLKDTISQIDNEIKKISKKENIDSDLQLLKDSLADLRASKERIFANSKQMVVKEIFWDLLPQGEWKTEDLIKTFESYGWSKNEFDENRLMQIIKVLKPNICYIGKEKFQGYVVFGFDSTKKVVLECPKYGNAIYIIEGNWQEITKLSKWEARKLSQVTVIRHSDTWFRRLKDNLDGKH